MSIVESVLGTHLRISTVKRACGDCRAYSRLVSNPSLGGTSRLPVIQEFLESIHTSRLQYRFSQACLRRHLSEMMDRIAKGPEDVKKSVRAADELP